MKDILVTASGSDLDHTRLDFAQTLARQNNAQLTILLVDPRRPAAPAYFTGAPGAIGVMVPEPLPPPDATDVEEPLAAIARRFADAENVRIVSVDAGEGSTVDRVVDCARTKDIVITAAPSAEGGVMRSVFDAVLSDQAAPVLAMPPEAEGQPDFTQVCIAWNGSAECSRALRLAMPLLGRAKKAWVVAVDKLRPAGADPVERTEVERHLEAHGIEAELLTVSSKGTDTAAAILAEAQRVGAGLLIGGGRAFGGFVEWLRGSVSRDLLKRAPLPMLLAS